MSEPTTPSAFAPPASDGDAPPMVHKHIGRLAGGELPSIGDLFSETMTEFVDNLGPYALAGLGQILVIMPLALVMVLVMYFGMFAVIMGMLVAMFGAIAVIPEDLAPVAAILVQLLAFAVMFAMIMGLSGLMAAVLAPITGSVYRAVGAHQRGDAKLEFNAAFSTIGQDIAPIVGATLIVMAAVMAGAMMCYFPALIAGFLLGFSVPAVALHRLGALAAVKQSVSHVFAHPGWHVGFYALYMLSALVGAYVPVIGTMFAISFQIRAYRHLFGDGEEPVVA